MHMDQEGYVIDSQTLEVKPKGIYRARRNISFLFVFYVLLFLFYLTRNVFVLKLLSLPEEATVA